MLHQELLRYSERYRYFNMGFPMTLSDLNRFLQAISLQYSPSIWTGKLKET